MQTIYEQTSIALIVIVLYSAKKLPQEQADKKVQVNNAQAACTCMLYSYQIYSGGGNNLGIVA